MSNESINITDASVDPLDDHLDDAAEPTAEEMAGSQLTLRALVSTKEAGVIIGKGGKNVAELRDATGVKAGVSKVVQGVHDRVLTVSGTLEGVAKAYSLIAQTLLENPITTSPPTSPTTPRPATTSITSVRLLISHNLMGTVIGRQGLKIKHIQDVSGARMVASKEMLPQSTERVVEVQGTVEAIRVALWEIGKCLVEDWERGVGTVLYNPATRVTGQSGFPGDRRASITRTGNGSDFSSRPNSTSGEPSYPGSRRESTSSQSFVNNSNLRQQNISIPSDMVGCIIGKAGSKISEIRRLSGSRISIAKVPHDETGERMFTIVGSTEANEKALYLLYGQLETEKERRLSAANDAEDDEE
ncbi:KH domain RNA-binding protein [Jimgerdemannia flammicorona]|uniref:KH domain RNA-binding protein n=2 Tax=Jimgerdemannia flammicorona TaxID=994334 RepID=A0A433DNE8_9FUNG|nr:KH domain RNA-binding protein [Jimgerdemannia flammicorona]RUS34792.1 KH domain RNA-binding protein [Jimgerdemannia flammicorona]